MKELWTKIKEALVSALPITLIVYILALTPLFNFTNTELITFTIGAVLLVLGIGLFNLGADLAMTPIGTHVGAGLSKQRKLGLLLGICFVLGMLITIAEPTREPDTMSLSNARLCPGTSGNDQSARTTFSPPCSFPS